MSGAAFGTVLLVAVLCVVVLAYRMGFENGKAQ
jgi:hypothetical protein